MHRPILGAAAALAMLPLAALAQSAAPKAPVAAPTAAAPSADPQEGRTKMRTACATDIQKFCANIERARGAMRACLEANEKDLTATCKAARAERAAERARIKG